MSDARRAILITGATGVLGRRLVKELSRESSTDLLLLTRASSEAELQAKRHSVLDSKKSEIENSISLRGDINLPWFGLGPVDLEMVRKKVTHIVHCAADLNLSRPLSEALRDSEASTSHLLALAETMPQLKKLEFVSTVGVLGQTPGELAEVPLESERKFHNSYEAAKAAAEKMLYSRLKELPITIHRPSMIVGDSKTGEISRFQIFYHICEFLTGRRTLGLLPQVNYFHLDTVPIEYVARLIVRSLNRPDLRGQIIHSCTGYERSLSLNELEVIIADQMQKRGLKVKRRFHLPTFVIWPLLRALPFFVGEKHRRALRSLSYMLSYLEARQSFASGKAAGLFSDLGPPPDPRSYLPQVLRFYFDNRG